MNPAAPPRRITEDRARSVVQDRMDVADFEHAATALPIDDADRRLEEANWTGPKLLRDLWASLYQPKPRLNDDLAPSYAINRRVIEQTMADAHWSDIRQHTVDDGLTSLIGSLTFRDRMVELFEQLQAVQETADDAQDKADQADQSEAEGGPNTDELRDLAQQAAAALAEQLDDVEPTIGRAVREAARETADKIDDQAQALAGWSLGKGEMVEMDPAERLELMDELMTDRFREIAKLFGAMRSELWGARDSRWEYGPDEVIDIKLGDDVMHLLGSDMLGLIEPDLELDFLERLAEKRLRQFETRTIIRETHGKIVYVRDSSGTMAGARDTWAAAICGALAMLAKESGRDFCCILFGGISDPMPIYELAADHWDLRTFVDMIGRFLNGGTTFETPLMAAAERIVAEFEATGRTEADIVFATDGMAPISEPWFEQFDAMRTRAGFKVWGLAIGVEADSPAIVKVSDRVAAVHELNSGQDVRDIFQKLQR